MGEAREGFSQKSAKISISCGSTVPLGVRTVGVRTFQNLQNNVSYYWYLTTEGDVELG